MKLIDREALLKDVKRDDMEFVVRSIAAPDGYTGSIEIGKTVKSDDKSVAFLFSPETRLYWVTEIYYTTIIAITGNETIIVVQLLNK